VTYTIDESLSDSEYTAAGDVPGTFGGTPRRIESITIHHWGVFGQTHDGVVDFFMRQSFLTSAHFVVSDGRIHCLVSPANASWAAGNAYGNATSIHIECRPEATDGDYHTVAWLVDFLRDHYGPNLPLIPHRYWQATACPGKWDLGRIDDLARAVEAPVPAPAPPAPAPMVPRVFGDDELHWIVDPGDTLTKIANYYGRTVAELAAYNNIDPDRIDVGQRIWIPGPLYWYVEPGDTLGAIAAYYGISVEVLAARNGLADPDRIGVGQRLQII
jgi:N-acetylmuramoyl-L-alanine amidase